MQRFHTYMYPDSPIRKSKPPPNSLLEVKAEAISLGLLLSKPTLDTGRKILISHVDQSHRINRSIGRTSVLLVGSTGVGKSCTINHLFGMKEGGVTFAQTNNQTSETRITTEYEMCADDPKYDVTDLKLGLVDSPGLNDTNGTRQDACNFYSIKQFYQTHPTASGCLPNLIFVMINAGDKRIDGPNSMLTKSLKCLMKLNLVDVKHPNVIGVMTHACHFGKKNWTQKFEEQKSVFKRILFKYLNVGVEVVTLENMHEDEELEGKGDWTILPDKKTWQPRNLFKACTDLLERNGDAFGHLTLSAVFGKVNHEPRKGHKVDAKNAATEKLNTEEKKFLDFFQDTAMGDGVEDPLFEAADRFMSGEKLDESQRSSVEDMTTKLRCIGVSSQEDLKKMSVDSIRFNTGGSFDDVQENFIKFLNVKQKKPVNLDDSIRLLGQGYNLLNDAPTVPVLLEYDTRNTTLGIIVPAPARFSKVDNTVTFMENFESHDQMMKSRMKHLNVSVGVQFMMFGPSVRAGFTLNSSSSASASSKEYSFLLEQRSFEVSMGNFKELSFTPDFNDAVKKLPDKFNVEDENNRQQFQKFFDRWGHFIVIKAFGGGSVEFKISTNGGDASSIDFASKKAELTAAFSTGIYGAGGSVSGELSSSSGRNAWAMLSHSTVKWSGGDSQFHNQETMSDPELMNKWKQSLILNPTMLNTELSLSPISDLVEQVDKNKEVACYNALESFLGGKFHMQTNKEAQAKLSEAAAAKTRQEEAENNKPKADEAKTRQEEAENNKPKADEEKCFSGNTMVAILTAGKEKKVAMKNLAVGDMVKTMDPKTKAVTFTPILLFADHDTTTTTFFKKLSLQDGKEITLTGNHLIFIGTEGKSEMVDKVALEDKVLLESGAITEVTNIADITEKGFFCPITREGTILVNNILASCYASCTDFAGIDSHRIAHLGLLPMRLAMRGGLLKKTTSSPKKHPYIGWLEKWFLPYMS